MKKCFCQITKQSKAMAVVLHLTLARSHSDKKKVMSFQASWSFYSLPEANKNGNKTFKDFVFGKFYELAISITERGHKRRHKELVEMLRGLFCVFSCFMKLKNT